MAKAKNSNNKPNKEDKDNHWQRLQKGKTLPVTCQDVLDLSLLYNLLGGEPQYNQEEE